MMIEEGQVLQIRNLLASGRKKVTPVGLQDLLKEIQGFIQLRGAEKAGGVISVTYGMDTVTQLMEVEIYVPVNMEIPSGNGFEFMRELRIENCVKITYKGNPRLLQNACNELNNYIAEHVLIPVSAMFTVTKNEITRKEDIDLFEVDVYVSVKPRIA